MYLSFTPSPPHSSSCEQSLQLRIISFRTLCGQRHRSCTAMVMRSSVWPAVQTEDTLHLLARSTFHSIPEWHTTHVLFPFYSTIPTYPHSVPPSPPTPILFHHPHLSPFLIPLFQASKTEHASIRVWSTDTWRQVTLLTHHTLTVTQLTFSHSGTHLLAVSRDRGWSLWKHTNKENGIYKHHFQFAIEIIIRKHPAYSLHSKYTGVFLYPFRNLPQTENTNKLCSTVIVVTWQVTLYIVATITIIPLPLPFFFLRHLSAPPFSLVASTDRSSRTHTRIIWSCAWAYDDSCFATASRDKKVDKTFTQSFYSPLLF